MRTVLALQALWHFCLHLLSLSFQHSSLSYLVTAVITVFLVFLIHAGENPMTALMIRTKKMPDFADVASPILTRMEMGLLIVVTSARMMLARQALEPAVVAPSIPIPTAIKTIFWIASMAALKMILIFRPFVIRIILEMSVAALSNSLVFGTNVASSA